MTRLSRAYFWHRIVMRMKLTKQYLETVLVNYSFCECHTSVILKKTFKLLGIQHWHCNISPPEHQGAPFQNSRTRFLPHFLFAMYITHSNFCKYVIHCILQCITFWIDRSMAFFFVLPLCLEMMPDILCNNINLPCEHFFFLDLGFFWISFVPYCSNCVIDLTVLTFASASPLLQTQLHWAKLKRHKVCISFEIKSNKILWPSIEIVFYCTVQEDWLYIFRWINFSE